MDRSLLTCSCASKVEDKHSPVCALWGDNDAARKQRIARYEADALKLSSEIKHRRIGLANEEALAEGEVLRGHARAKKYRDQDRYQINGMVLALTYWLGRPLDIAAAEAFIKEAP